MLVKQGWGSLTYPSGPSSGRFQAVTDVCFRPKALLVYLISTANFVGSAGAGSAAWSSGWTTGPTNTWSLNGRLDASSVKFSDVDFTTLGGGMGLDANLTSFDAQGFTLELPFNGTYRFFYLAFGGDDLQAAAGDFTTPPQDTFPDVVVTGLGFKPDFLLAQNRQNDSFLDICMSWGMASSPTNQAAMSGSRYLFGLDHHTLLNGFLTCPWGDGSGALDNRTRLKSFDADGFTIAMPWNRYSQSPPFNRVHYLALHDPSAQFRVGVETQKTSPGTKATTGLGFRPGGGLFFGSYKTTDNDLTYAGPPLWSWGAADGAGNSGVAVEFNEPGSGTGENSYQNPGEVLCIAEVPFTLRAAASVSSWDADGFTLNYSAADAVARKFIYGVFSTHKADPCKRFRPQIYRLVKGPRP